MDLEEKVKVATRNVVETLTLSEVIETLRGGNIKGYIGVEPSGLFHIGWLIWARKVRDLLDVGVKMKILEATWHAWINDKLSGDLDVIHKCATYMEHVLKALSIDKGDIEYIRAEKLVSDPDYWKLVITVAKNVSLARVRRAVTIMGRKESESILDFSKLIYPCMQVADIFYMDLDLCLGGTDQRKAHVLAREVAEKNKWKKPVALHTPLLIGLRPPLELKEVDETDIKMSKSKPESCIFVHDTPEEIARKINSAYCPPRVIEMNPLIEICKHLLFADPSFRLYIEREDKYGGDLYVESYTELAQLYAKGDLHPQDLKQAVSKALSNMLEPVRRYFESNKEARDLLETMKRATITR
ncbi:MAG: tyrosine--tRNA ligase [Candidatus Nezhaarchaeota archaeon]|nr:tyrosine--tRNA ligase [Candidatus Nezhaarchaeota archaeon]MCX8142047.1 tyrosine--tRNA ligase [Candidatus Nezhaarchaeota archaeon]MDW8050172.1 tyrosine--tRNA ligase [Nitrososphaerota archaeon]